VGFVWSKSVSLVFVVSFVKAKAHNFVSRCALSERSSKLFSCRHCASPFIMPEPAKRT